MTNLNFQKLKSKKLEEFLSKNFQTNVLIRKKFFDFIDNGILKKIEKTRVCDLKKPFTKQEQSNSENQVLEMFDGFEINKVIREHIPSDEKQCGSISCNFYRQINWNF